MSGSEYEKGEALAQIIYKGTADISKIAKGLILIKTVTIAGDGTASYTVTIGKTMANTDYQCIPIITLDSNSLALNILNIQNKTTTTFDLILSGNIGGAQSIHIDFLIIGLEA